MTNQEIVMYGEALCNAYFSHEQIEIPSLKHPDISFEEAYAIQNVLTGKLAEKGFTPCGKKVGLTSDAMRKAANIYEPDYGIIFSEMSYENESTINLDDFISPRIECELAFKLNADLDMNDVTEQDVINATEYVVACMEICDFRIFRDKVQRVVQDSISDNAAFGGYILGDVPCRVQGRDLSLVPYIFEINNQVVESSCGAAVYDNPAKSVAWLANTFNRLGQPLKKGEVILSGSAVASVPLVRNSYLKCSYGDIGYVACRIV